MLRQVLKAFGEDNVLSTASLAEKAGVQEVILLQMLDELVRLGYLAENADCVTSCTDCGIAKACNSSNGQRMWLLTTKGQRTIA